MKRNQLAMSTCIVILFCIYLILIKFNHSLFCYKGTFNNTIYGEDPLHRTSLYPSSKLMARIRCSLTFLCNGTYFLVIFIYYLENSATYNLYF